MAQQHPSIPESSRYPAAPQPFLQTADGLGPDSLGPDSLDPESLDFGGAPSRRIPARPLTDDVAEGGREATHRRVLTRSKLPTDVQAATYVGGMGAYRGEAFDSRRPAAVTSAPRRQPRAEDDVHYTTSPFAKPDSSTTAIDPTEKRGLGSRVAGSGLVAAGAVVGAAGLVLLVLLQVYIAVPVLLIAGGLIYSGRGSLRESAEKAD